MKGETGPFFLPADEGREGRGVQFEGAGRDPIRSNVQAGAGSPPSRQTPVDQKSPGTAVNACVSGLLYIIPEKEGAETKGDNMAELDRRDFVKLGAATAAGAGALVSCSRGAKEKCTANSFHL